MVHSRGLGLSHTVLILLEALNQSYNNVNLQSSLPGHVHCTNTEIGCEQQQSLLFGDFGLQQTSAPAQHVAASPAAQSPGSAVAAIGAAVHDPAPVAHCAGSVIAFQAQDAASKHYYSQLALFILQVALMRVADHIASAIKLVSKLLMLATK